MALQTREILQTFVWHKLPPSIQTAVKIGDLTECIFVSLPQITLKLGNFTDSKVRSTVELTDSR